jgi:ABC-type phosphate transport system substrate-binding protein
MKTPIAGLWVLIAGAILAGPALAGDIAVIVNPANPAILTKGLVVSYYLGESKSWSGGVPVKLLELPPDNPARVAFDKDVLGRSAQQLKDLWSQNSLSGKAIPPKELASDEEVKKAVSSSKIAIGYIKASSVDDTVKVALTF